MKSAVNKGGPLPTPVLSHIPLPRRKSSNKSDKGLELNDTDSELGSDSMATRSQAKTSLLSGTSFCCVSGQKEDYLPDAKIPPVRKRTPNVSAKHVQDSSTPNSPLVPPSKALLRNRRGRIIESNSEDTISQLSETGLLKQSLEDIKIRPPGDSRLRPPDQRGWNTPSSPHRKISRDPLPFHKDNLEIKKPAEAGKKLRKDSSPRTVAKDLGAGRKSKDNRDPPKEPVPGISAASKSSSLKCTNGESNAGTCYGTSDKCRLKNETSRSIDMGKNVGRNVNIASATVSTCDTRELMDTAENDIVDLNKSDVRLMVGNESSVFTDSTMSSSGVMKNSHDSDDFDCPCCDRTSVLVDGPMSDSEIHVFTSCEVVAPPPQILNTDDTNNKISYFRAKGLLEQRS